MTTRARAETLRKLFQAESLGSPENAVGFILWRLTARYQREMDRVLLPLDLTHLQFVTLALVAWFERKGEPVRQVEIATFAGIHPMQLSLMLKTLEKKEFVSRERDEADSRAKRIQVSSTGLTALRKALPLAIEVQQRIFGNEGKPGGSLQQTLLRFDQSTSIPEAEAS